MSLQKVRFEVVGDVIRNQKGKRIVFFEPGVIYVGGLLHSGRIRIFVQRCKRVVCLNINEFKLVDSCEKFGTGSKSVPKNLGCGIDF